MKYHGYREYLAHPVFKVIRSNVMERSGGMCEICETNIASEVHHFQEGKDMYPPWGVFDAPSKLKALCHQCHCKEHEVTE